MVEMKSVVSRCLGLAFFLPLALLVTSTAAFQAPVIPRVSSSLKAWSLPNLNPSSALSTTWYCEYNPTARRTVYNDDPTEQYNFVVLGDDWDIDEKETSKVRRRRRSPLRSLLRRRALLRILFRTKQW